MAAAGWLRRAASAAALPRMPSGFSLMPTPPPAPLQEAQSLVLPGLGATIAPAMELMAVPKKKISKYKRGLRNGPKALKPVPVIVRCRCCGRVKLPHFYCCSGERGNAGDSSS